MNEVTNLHDEAIRQSQALSGQSGNRIQIPYVPIMIVNNKKTKRRVEVDGVEQDVEIPPKKGFWLTIKDANDKYEDVFVEGDISGVILKERYMIEKKPVPGAYDDQYRSNEFDDWNEEIHLYNQKDKKTFFEGTYQEVKAFLPTSKKIVRGKEIEVKDYNLLLVLYINLEDKGQIVRLKLKMTSENGWFDYKKSFGQNEPWAAFLTHFDLIDRQNGDVFYRYVKFNRGVAVDLTKELGLQIEMSKFFSAARRATTNKTFVKPTSIDDSSQPFHQDALPIIQTEDEPIDDEEIRVEDIPF